MDESSSEQQFCKSDTNTLVMLWQAVSLGYESIQMSNDPALQRALEGASVHLNLVYILI